MSFFSPFIFFLRNKRKGGTKTPSPPIFLYKKKEEKRKYGYLSFKDGIKCTASIKKVGSQLSRVEI